MVTKQRQQKVTILQVITLIVIAAMILAACQPSAPAVTTAPTEAAAPTEAVAPPTEAPTQAVAPTEAPTEAPTAVITPTAEVTSTAEVSGTANLDVRNFSPDIPDPTSPVVVTFASWAHQPNPNDIWEVLAKEFNRIHPNIKIEFQDVPAEEMHDKLLTQVGANNPPDSAYVDSGTVGDFATRGALVRLNDYISKSQIINTSDYVPQFLKIATVVNSTKAEVKDGIYGLPIDGETTGLFYRTDRFQEAGLDPNNPPKTWEEFKAAADKLTDTAKKKYGFIQFATEATYYFLPWLWSAGAEEINPKDPNDVVWDSPEGQKAADFYVSLVKDSPPDFLSSNSWDGRTAFANGDVAMYVAGAWFGGTITSEFPDETKGKWAAAPMPVDKRCATTIASDDLVVFKGSKNADAAYKWIEFVSAPKHMALLNVGTPENPATLLPPLNSLLNDESLYVGRPFLKAFAEMFKCAHVTDVNQPKLGEAEEILRTYLEKAFYGQITGAEAVKQAAVDAEKLFKQP